jgi:hypothetical protein
LISPLWKEANKISRNKTNSQAGSQWNIAGIWGAMSDIEEKFESGETGSI